MPRQTTVFDYHPFLTRLSHSGIDYFLEGGQAVNFWAEYYSAKNRGSELDDLKPFTSEDCDLWVSHVAWKHFQQEEKGNLTESSSPVDGQLGILRLGKEPSLIVDLMGHVYGFPAGHSKVYADLMERAAEINNILVLDPVSLFRSKGACLHGLRGCLKKGSSGDSTEHSLGHR